MRAIIFIVLFLVLPKMEAQTIRNFSLEDLKKQVVNYDEVKGEKLTVLDFWASWCRPCLKAMPKIEKLHKDYGNQGVQFVGVNCDGPRSISKVAPLVKALNISYTVLTDMNNGLMQDLEVGALPTLLIVDASDKVVYRHEGFSSGDEVEIQRQIVQFLKGE